jgi:hypothetical protein
VSTKPSAKKPTRKKESRSKETTKPVESKEVTEPDPALKKTTQEATTTDAQNQAVPSTDPNVKPEPEETSADPQGTNREADNKVANVAEVQGESKAPSIAVESSEEDTKTGVQFAPTPTSSNRPTTPTYAEKAALLPKTSETPASLATWERSLGGESESSGSLYDPKKDKNFDATMKPDRKKKNKAREPRRAPNQSLDLEKASSGESDITDASIASGKKSTTSSASKNSFEALGESDEESDHEQSNKTTKITSDQIEMSDTAAGNLAYLLGSPAPKEIEEALNAQEDTVEFDLDEGAADSSSGELIDTTHENSVSEETADFGQAGTR